MPAYNIKNMMLDGEKNKEGIYTNGMNGLGPSVIVLPSTKTKDDSQNIKTESVSTWKKTLLGFTENTTLHGVRFIFMEHLFIIRRAVWLLLFSLCSVLMMVQIIERIVFFYSFPMTVNVQVNYNKTLAFPAITICNQNTFRATAAAENNLYHLLEAMHSNNMSTTNSSCIYEYGAENITLDYLFLVTKHLKEDLIHKCEWYDTKCGPDNFTETLTDHGVCFTFNHDPLKPLVATSAGADYGLRLTVNVEQYEYMPGPHNAAGIKVHLHDHNDFPKVAELGLAIPTGSRTFVGIQMCTIENLPAPHGSCNSIESPFYKKYTPNACQMTCTTLLTQKICGCRHFYLPHVGNEPPVCTLEQHIECYNKYEDEIKAHVRDKCDCPVPCDFLIYDPTVSFATTSAYAADKLLGTTGIAELRMKYHHAQEITSRMDRQLFEPFQNLEQDMKYKFGIVRDMLNQDVRQKLEYQQRELSGLYKKLHHVYKQKEFLLLWQEFHVRKNFVRAKNAMEERTLSVMARSYQEFAYITEARIAQLAARNGDEPLYSKEVRTAIFLALDSSIRARIDSSTRSHQNYTELYTAYETGTPIFRYVYKNESLNSYITPRPLLKHALTHNDLAKEKCEMLDVGILDFVKALWKYLEIAQSAFDNSTLDAGKLHDVNVMFLYAGRSFYHSKSVFYSECIDYPLRYLLDRYENFTRLWRIFDDRFNSFDNIIESLLEDLNLMKSTTLQTLQNIVDLSNNFTTNLNMTKLEIAHLIISEKTLESTSDLKNFMSKFRLRGQSVYDAWNPLLDSATNIWSFILGDENLKEYYTEKNMTEYLRDYEEVAKEVIEIYTRVRDECDFRPLLESQDSLFLNSLQKMIEHMNHYHDSSQLDTNFLRNNFLQLDVFYREKSYEQITQQKAYDMFALLCDIGGSMGLFVGASFLTLYEIVDFGVHQCLLTLIKRCIS